MIPPQFDYVRPGGLDEALRILSEREGEAKVLAGGYSLIPLLKLRLAQPAVLVDLRDVGGIDGIVELDDELVIGGRATHRRILEDPTVRAGYPMLTDAAGVIGDPQVRNWGTIGGSVAHADPAADWPSILCASRATVVVRSVAGERRIAARSFFLDPFVTAIEPTEILT
jgi:carbon-monoxide dehydrogenase medium subunit